MEDEEAPFNWPDKMPSPGRSDVVVGIRTRDGTVAMSVSTNVDPKRLGTDVLGKLALALIKAAS